MPSPLCERAIADALRVGTALLKFISPNDVGLTGGHQKGYYLPKSAWRTFTPFEPTRGVNNDHRVRVLWQDGRVTASTVKWYGTGTRREYRLTGFNKERHFPYLIDECVGSLLVLIPETIDSFLIYAFDLEEDIEDLQAGLGTEVLERWALYSRAAPPPESEDDCIERHFREFAKTLSGFPQTIVFANAARTALEACLRNFDTGSSDEQLSKCVEAEYRLFRFVERKVCEPDIVRLFASVDDFLQTAQSILQRRKARAGRSLEHHVEALLLRSRIAHEMRVEVEGTRPDILFPSRVAYLDPSFPVDRLLMLGVKTTCKDRWRQVLSEAPRMRSRHILTLQAGISEPQLDEMARSGVTLVVPENLHSAYPPSRQPLLMTVEQFFTEARAKAIV